MMKFMTQYLLLLQEKTKVENLKIHAVCQNVVVTSLLHTSRNVRQKRNPSSFANSASHNFKQIELGTESLRETKDMTHFFKYRNKLTKKYTITLLNKIKS